MKQTEKSSQHLQAFLYFHGTLANLFLSYFVNMSSSKCFYPIGQTREGPWTRADLAATHTSQTLHNDGLLNGHLIRNGATQCFTVCMCVCLTDAALCVCVHFSCCRALLLLTVTISMCLFVFWGLINHLRQRVCIYRSD